jgi:hypothetical protein
MPLVGLKFDDPCLYLSLCFLLGCPITSILHQGPQDGRCQAVEVIGLQDAHCSSLFDCVGGCLHCENERVLDDMRDDCPCSGEFVPR